MDLVFVNGSKSFLLPFYVGSIKLLSFLMKIILEMFITQTILQNFTHTLQNN